MKKFAKVLAALTAFCLALALVSCGKKTGASGPVKIDLWYGASVTEAGPPPADWVALKVIKEKLNIDLTLSALPSNDDDQDVKIQAAAASNALPDLFQVRRPVLSRLVSQNLVAAVDEMYPLMPTRVERLYNANAIAFTTFNGKSYGLASHSSYGLPRNEGMLIRKDWLDKLGLAAPVTTQDYLDVMKAFTEKDPDGNGKADTYGYGAFIEINSYEEGLGRRFDPFFGAFGVAGTWNLDKNSPGLNVRKPAYYDAMAYIKSLVDARALDPNWVSYKKDDFRASWKQGRFGVMREQHAAYANESNYSPFDKNFPNGSWVVIDPPVGPGGQSSVGVYTSGYRTYAVSKKAADDGKLPAIARLLEWMSSDEGYYLLGFGEKGVNYMLNADGVPVVQGIPDESKGYTKPEMQPLTQLRSMVFYASRIELVSRYPTYQTPSGKTMSALDTYYDMAARPWTPNDGADAMPLPEADLKRFYEQGVAEFLTGQRQFNKANWDAWVAEFDKLGGKAWEDAGIAYAQENSLLR